MTSILFREHQNKQRAMPNKSNNKKNNNKHKNIKIDKKIPDSNIKVFH